MVMNDAVWHAMEPWQLLAIGLCFLWSGFVRSGLGFGGAALTLPLLLMIENDPLFFLPAICWQLLIFSLLTISTRWRHINWTYLRHLCLILFVPYVGGLIGLLKLSGSVVSTFVYTVTLIYGCMFMLNRAMQSRSRWMDALCIVGGGYASGVSLVGAPLIVAYSTRRLTPGELRDTLFAMWLLFVFGKLSAFSVADVNLQWQLTLITLPLVTFGHCLGLWVHQRLVSCNLKHFHQVIGFGLVAVSILGLRAVL